MNNKLEELRARVSTIKDLEAANALMSWDQQVNMPEGGAQARAAQMSTLQKAMHEHYIADEMGQLLADLEPDLEELDYDSFEASLIRATRRQYDRRYKVPPDLIARRAKTTALAHVAWEKARAASDFDMFQPHLQEVVDVTIEIAEALGYEDRIYDALLNRFEPEMKTAQVERLFEEMKTGLVPLVQAIAGRPAAVDDSVFGQEFDEQKQWDFGVEVIKRLGYDFDCGRQDLAAHPFTISFSPGDVRITTRVYPDQFKTALFGTIHEAGHGMYEQGIDRALDRTPLSDGASFGVHESQSRMWENVVGRSRGFWTYWYPRLRAYFPGQLADVNVEGFYRAINRVEPSLIRVEADEVTYNLHIFLRFEIENLLLEGQVKVGELPALWNEKMVEYLGIRPPDDAQGVLQDVHWSSGYIGYFPTYSLGNLLAAQFYNEAVADRPDIPAQIEKGEFGPLFDWLRTRIHAPGAKYTPTELVERVTGGPIRTEPFLAYVQEKYSNIYRL